MPNLLFIAARTGARFFRAGREFVKEGGLHDVSDWAEYSIQRIMNEPNLHVRPPTEAEEEAFLAALDAEPDPELHDALLQAIPGLPHGAFKADGHPKLPSVRKAMPDHDGATITAGAVAAAMTELTAGGFKPPSEQV